MCILVPSIVLSWEHVAAGVCLFDRRYAARIIGQARFILKISSFIGIMVLLDKIIDQGNIVHWLQVVPEVTLCAWTHILFSSSCAWSQIYGTMILHWCCHMEHLLHLRSYTPTTTTSIYNYIGYYSSAVGLDVLRFEQCLFCCRLSMIALRFEQCLPFVNDSATFIVSWCDHLLMLVKH